MSRIPMTDSHVVTVFVPMPRSLWIALHALQEERRLLEGAKPSLGAIVVSLLRDHPRIKAAFEAPQPQAGRKHDQ